MKALLFVVLAVLWIVAYFVALFVLSDLSVHYDSGSWPKLLGLAFIFFLSYVAVILLIDWLHQKFRRVR